MKGLLIVFEGLDCSGKTTAINEILKNLKDKRFVYSKGIGSNTFIGNISRKLHATFFFYVELFYVIIINIIPNNKNGKIILQDRYDISINSYIPLTKRWYNKIWILLFRPIIIKPDAIIYFYLSLQERIKRLKEKGTKYELMLSENPELILAREKEYLKWYNGFNGPKIKIDTYENNIKETTQILNDFILSIVNDIIN